MRNSNLACRCNSENDKPLVIQHFLLAIVLKGYLHAFCTCICVSAAILRKSQRCGRWVTSSYRFAVLVPAHRACCRVQHATFGFQEYHIFHYNIRKFYCLTNLQQMQLPSNGWKQVIPLNYEYYDYSWINSDNNNSKGNNYSNMHHKQGENSGRVINCISRFCMGHISTWGFRTSIHARFAPVKSTTPYTPPSLYTDPLTGEPENPFKCFSKCLLHLRSFCYKINSVRYGAIYNLICYSSRNLLGQLIFIRYAQSWFSKPIELGIWNVNIIWFSECYCEFETIK